MQPETLVKTARLWHGGGLCCAVHLMIVHSSMEWERKRFREGREGAELEWPRHDHKLTPTERDRAVDELLAMVADVDGILQSQSSVDSEYFIKASGASLHPEEVENLRSCLLKAYRWQYIFSGVEHPRYRSALGNLVDEVQANRINEALAALRD